eukprot:3881426-Rhodomonas_salina.3
MFGVCAHNHLTGSPDPGPWTMDHGLGSSVWLPSVLTCSDSGLVGACGRLNSRGRSAPARASSSGRSPTQVLERRWRCCSPSSALCRGAEQREGGVAAAVEKRTLMKVKEEAEKKGKEVEEERKAKEEEKKAKEEAETELKAAKESNEK